MMTPEQAAFNLAVALGLSAVIGFERQWRNRLAGLRTNTLVALGAATFVVFEQLFPDESSPTRVAPGRVRDRFPRRRTDLSRGPQRARPQYRRHPLVLRRDWSSGRRRLCPLCHDRDRLRVFVN